MGSEKPEYTVDKNGTIIYSGSSVITKGDHSGMPGRTDAYLPTDERGHVQASSLGGDNSRINVVPQDKDVNHGVYFQMENEERSILKSGGEIQSEKIAFASTQAGQRPDVFIVNDRVTHPDGKTETLHLSFQNASSDLQESWATSIMEHSDMLDVPNGGDVLREEMSVEEYAKLMEETDVYLSDIKDDYSPHIYAEHNSSSMEQNEIESDITEGNGIDEVTSDDDRIGMEFTDCELSVETEESNSETTDVSDTSGNGISDTNSGSGGLL